MQNFAKSILSDIFKERFNLIVKKEKVFKNFQMDISAV